MTHLSAAHDETVGVGTFIQHMLPHRDDCKYHAATVVAVDKGDLVTLEADVSKPLGSPEFVIRKGVWGFLKENDQTYTLENEGEVKLGRHTPRYWNKAQELAGMRGEFNTNDFEAVMRQGLIATNI